MTNLEMLLRYFSEEPEALARKLSALQCDECCVGCRIYCKENNHGDKGCTDTILEWLKEEAPLISQNAYMTRIKQERKRWMDVFDKIEAEIEAARFTDSTKLCKNANASGLAMARLIIDKYRSRQGR